MVTLALTLPVASVVAIAVRVGTLMTVDLELESVLGLEDTLSMRVESIVT